jgi:hypothetical protein
MKLFYKILFNFLGKGLFSLPLHNPGRITSISTHINTFISELVFSLGERREEFRMALKCDTLPDNNDPNDLSVRILLTITITKL